MSDIIQSTTQQFLDIYDITNNFVIMKNGTVSTILTVDAMNFGLLAEEEQDAIMYAYAGLLNSLNYPIQIIINSQTKDVTSYLKILQEQELEANNETMRRRIRMYREFVGNLIHERNVLDKKFYVVIPATALEMGFLATSSILPGSKPFDISTVERSLIIEKAQNLLDPKRDHLIAQFARIGLFSRQLATQEIIQLFYIRYNPEAIEGQQIAESSSYTTPLVKASIQETIMNSTPAALTQPSIQPGLGGQPDPNQLVVPQTTLNETVEQVQPLPEIHVSTQPSEQTTQVAQTMPEQASDQPLVVPETTVPIAETSSSPTMPPLTQAAPTVPPMITPKPSMPMQPAAEISGSTEVFSATAAPPAPVATTGTSSEQDIQADLNAAVQSLGVTPIAMGTTATAVSAAPVDDLPPLPEI